MKCFERSSVSVKFSCFSLFSFALLSGWFRLVQAGSVITEVSASAGFMKADVWLLVETCSVVSGL